MDHALLSVKGLTRRFGGFTAVQKVSFDLEQGEILGLIGPNGSGKSTTFNLIAGALAPSEGSIRLYGKEIGGMVPSKVCRAGVARTFQIPRPFRKLSILENASLAAFYGAATRPQLLLADESLGGLDENEMEQAADMLSRIRRERGITIIWVEHIMGVLMRVVDRCIVLDHGEVIAQGSPTRVANHPKVIEVYLGTDAAQVQDQVHRQDQAPRPDRVQRQHQEQRQDQQQRQDRGQS